MKTTINEQEIQDGLDIMDREHQLHLELILALRRAAEDGSPAAKLHGIAGQILEFSSAHFMSEQLLMRLHAYPDYEGHVQEHDRLAERITSLRDGLGDSNPAPDPAVLASLEQDLVRHIHEQDGQLARFLTEGREDLPTEE